MWKTSSSGVCLQRGPCWVMSEDSACTETGQVKELLKNLMGWCGFSVFPRCHIDHIVMVLCIFLCFSSKEITWRVLPVYIICVSYVLVTVYTS